MWRRLIFILPLVLPTTAIKVPMSNLESENKDGTSANKSARTQQKPHIYVSDESIVDSYLLPPDPHKPYEVLPDYVVTPATYLLPPSAEPESNYFYPTTEPGEQSDWYPIVHEIPMKTEQLPPLKYDESPVILSNNNESKGFENIRLGKKYFEGGTTLRKPSTRLHPPSTHFNDPIVEIHNESLSNNNDAYDENTKYSDFPGIFSKHHRLRQEAPMLALHLTPPKPLISIEKTPTKLFPKKFLGEFKPVSIPTVQFSGSLHQIPRVMPGKYLKSIQSAGIEYFPHPEEKKVFLYGQAEQKHQMKGLQVPNESVMQHGMEGDEIAKNTGTYIKPVVAEQETSETNHRYPRRKVYPTPLRQATSATTHQEIKSAAAPGERTEFRMHGLKGPHSYQFGYDTGKGKNRQFRFEERDNDGQVRGHYGYMDKFGKLQVVNYSAHPDFGFHADAPVEKE